MRKPTNQEDGGLVCLKTIFASWHRQRTVKGTVGEGTAALKGVEYSDRPAQNMLYNYNREKSVIINKFTRITCSGVKAISQRK